MILFLDITKMDSDLARRVLIIYAREIKRLSVVKSYAEMLPIFESSISLEIKDSVDRQQLQNICITTAQGYYQFYCLHK